MAHGSTGAGGIAAKASISSMLISRRLREQAAVNVVGSVDVDGVVALNWRGPMQDLIDATLTVETMVLKTVEVTVTKRLLFRKN